MQPALFKRYQVLSATDMADSLSGFALTPAVLVRQSLRLAQAPLDQLQVALIQEHAVTEALIQPYRQALLQLGWPHHCASLVDGINGLVMAWVDMYAAGVPLEAVESLLRPLVVPQWFSQSRTQALRRFLAQLFITSAARYEQAALNYAKHHDQFTGLPNRHLLTEQTQQLLTDQADVGLLLIRFKLTATAMEGHRYQLPELVLEIIRRLQQNLAKDQHLFHLGAYEFAVLAPQLDHEMKLGLLSAKLHSPFELTVSANQQLFSVSPVTGGLCRHHHHQQATEMLAQARLALQHADKTGQPFVPYSEALASKAAADAQLRQDVLAAFENDRLELYLQPIVDTYTGHCISAETLLRCRNANGDFIPPPFVIEVLYQQGLGHMFIRWLINTVCRLASDLKQHIRQPVSLSINLTADDFVNHELPYLLAQALKLWDVEGSTFILEITEEGLLIDNAAASQIMDAFTNLGCHMALDDFGMGYSSLSRLRNLPIDLVKIDQSFVRNVANSSRDKAIVQGIITMAHGLGKKVVAEGVEDAACLAVIQALQCERIQGYYFSRPLPFEQFLAWVAAQTAAPEEKGLQANLDVLD